MVKFPELCMKGKLNPWERWCWCYFEKIMAPRSHTSLSQEEWKRKERKETKLLEWKGQRAGSVPVHGIRMGLLEILHKKPISKMEITFWVKNHTWVPLRWRFRVQIKMMMKTMMNEIKTSTQWHQDLENLKLRKTPSNSPNLYTNPLLWSNELHSQQSFAHTLLMLIRTYLALKWTYLTNQYN